MVPLRASLQKVRDALPRTPLAPRGRRARGERPR